MEKPENSLMLSKYLHQKYFLFNTPGQELDHRAVFADKPPYSPDDRVCKVADIHDSTLKTHTASPANAGDFCLASWDLSLNLHYCLIGKTGKR